MIRNAATTQKEGEWIVMNRHASRQRALQTLFQMDISRADLERAAEYTLQVAGEEGSGGGYFRTLAEGVTAHQAYIDLVLRQYSEDWRLDRMPGVDRNILRIGSYELIYETDVPPAVVLNEAVELAKEYGTEESPRFINGVLAGLLKDLEGLRKRALGSAT